MRTTGRITTVASRTGGEPLPDEPDRRHAGNSMIVPMPALFDRRAAAIMLRHAVIKISTWLTRY
jgi:hypothetical protein